MKINFLISSLSGGGAEKVLTTLANTFAENGNDVSILSLEKRPQFYKVGDNVALFKKDDNSKSGIKGFFSDYKFVSKFMTKQKADINVSFLSRCNYLSLIRSIFSHDKVIVCDRNNPLKEHSKKVFVLSCWLYRFASAIAVQTETIKSYYPKYLQKKIYVIENPLDVVTLERQLEGEEITSEDTIVSMGRLEKQKDFKTLIRAFSKIADKCPGWNVKIYGMGEMKDELQKIIEENKMSDKILLCGRTEKPFYALKSARIFVLSSYYEGFPNVLCEGMYAGLPCISSDCISGPSELIDEGKNGYLFPIEDSDKLADDLLLLINDDGLRKKIGENAKVSVTERLLIDTIFEKWDGLFKQII